MFDDLILGCIIDGPFLMKCDCYIFSQIGAARFRAPEVLFRPDLIGEECESMHEVLLYSVQKSDTDLRKVLYQNIVLSGGSTLFKVAFSFTLYVAKKVRQYHIKIFIGIWR